MPTNNGGSIKSFTSAVAGGRVRLHGSKHVFQVTGQTSAGAGSATYKIQFSSVDSPDEDATSGDDGGAWVDAGPAVTMTLSATIQSDYLVIDAPWKWARLNVSAISGTDATVEFHKSTSAF